MMLQTFMNGPTVISLISKRRFLTNMLVASAVFQSMDKTLERLLKKSTSAYDYIVLLAQSMLPVYTRVYPVFLFYI